jgi:ABC-2 type transport system ATP-binding protein
VTRAETIDGVTNDPASWPVVVCRDITKYYPEQLSIRALLTLRLKRRKKLVLDTVSFDVHRGEIFGIIGPNGAGKTTILKILCRLTIPTRGTAHVCGYNIDRDWRHVINHIGYCISEERSFFWRLTGRQNLEFFADLLEVEPRTARRRIDELLDLLELTDVAGDRFMNYSSGMKQKMAVARSLLSDPEVLFMDEPTRGLDPRTASRLRTFIRDYIRKHDKTVIVTTNRVSDIEHLCQRLLILDRGRIAACGTISEICGDVRRRCMIDGEPSFEEAFNLLLDTERT